MLSDGNLENSIEDILQVEHKTIVCFLEENLPRFIDKYRLTPKQKDLLKNYLKIICANEVKSFKFSQEEIAKKKGVVASNVSRDMSDFNKVLKDFSEENHIEPPIQLFLYRYRSGLRTNFGLHFVCSVPKIVKQYAKPGRKKGYESEISCSDFRVPFEQARKRDTNQVKTNVLDKFITLIGGEADAFRLIDKIFVPPKSYEKISNSLAQNKPVMIIGNSGDGKSYTGCYMMFEALCKGRNVKYTKRPSGFMNHFTTFDIVACQQLLPENGLLFIDDPLGCDEEPTAPNITIDKILKLCNRTASRSCSIVITSQTYYVDQNNGAREALTSAGVDFYDFSDQAVGITTNMREQIYLNLIKNHRDIKKPLISNNLETEGAAFISKYKLNLLQTEMWAQKSLLVHKKEEFDGALESIFLGSLFSLVSSGRFSEERQMSTFLLSFMNGALISDIQVEWKTINSYMNQQCKFESWHDLFKTNQEFGEMRIEFRHSIIAKGLDKIFFDKFGPARIIDLLKKIIANKRPSIKRAGVKSLFRLGAFLGDAILEGIDYIMGTDDKVALLEITGQLGMFLEKRPTNDIIQRMKSLFYVEEPIIIHQWINTVIRGWEKMPEEIRNEINLLLTLPYYKYKYGIAKEHAFEELVIQMSKRVDIFLNPLIDLVTNHRRRIQRFALEIIKGFCFRMDVTTDKVLEVVEPLMPLLYWGDLKILKEEVLNVSDFEIYRYHRLILLINRFEFSGD
jgi:hypothetical protein